MSVHAKTERSYRSFIYPSVKTLYFFIYRLFCERIQNGNKTYFKNLGIAKNLKISSRNSDKELFKVAFSCSAIKVEREISAAYTVSYASVCYVIAVNDP